MNVKIKSLVGQKSNDVILSLRFTPFSLFTIRFKARIDIKIKL